MIELLINVPFWLSVAFLVAVRWRGRDSLEEGVRTPALGRRIKGVFRSPLVVAMLLAGALSNVGLALYFGYVAPRDMMQDIVSAQQFLERKPLYPAAMTELIREALVKEPASFSLSGWVPGLKAREQRAYEEVVTEPWVQAHPPTMTLGIAPLVAAFGIHGTFLVLSLLSLLALALIAVMLRIGPLSGARPKDVAIIALCAAGWFAVSDLLRLGQSGLVLSALLTAGWYLIRRGRPVLAGMAVGVATCLKLFPGLVLLYLLLRHPKAGLAGLATAAVIGVATIAGIGPQNGRDYFATSRFVVEHYRSYAENLSLLTPFAIAERWSWLPPGSASVLFLLAAAAVVALSLRHSGPPYQAGQEPSGFDLEYCRVLSAIPLITPICWAHYLPLLILPLAVMGRRALDGRISWRVSCGYAAVVSVLCFPESTVMNGWVLLTTTFHSALAMGSALLWRSVPTLAVLALLLLLDWTYRRAVRKGAAAGPEAQRFVLYHMGEKG